MVLYIAISQISERIGSRASYQSIGRPLLRHNRTAFLTIFTSIFILALHGTNTLKLLLACYINYAIATKVSSTSYAALTPFLIWTWNIGLLFLIHWNEGFAYKDIASGLSWLVSASRKIDKNESAKTSVLDKDNYNGLLPRWQINYNITMLRLVSFSMDFYWASKASQKEAAVEEEVRGRVCPL